MNATRTQTEIAAPDLSIVVPVYNSASTLRPLVERLFRALDGVVGDVEVILVDDGSADESWRVISELARQWPTRVVAVQLMRNYGQHNALMCGFRHSRGRFIVTMDDDLQNPPEEVAKLWAAIQDDRLDLVYGVYAVKEHGAWRNFGSALVRFFYRVVFQSSVQTSSFRILRRELLESILPYDLNFTFVDGLLAWNTRRIGSVLVQHQPRQEGRSTYSLRKLLTLALNLFTNFSLLPLQFVSALGVLASVSGALIGIYYLVLAVRDQIAVPGYASIIIAVLVLGGLQLLALGVMGEYLGRVHLNINRKPQYTVRQVIATLDDARQDAAQDGQSSTVTPEPRVVQRSESSLPEKPPTVGRTK